MTAISVVLIAVFVVGILGIVLLLLGELGYIDTLFYKVEKWQEKVSLMRERRQQEKAFRRGDFRPHPIYEERSTNNEMDSLTPSAIPPVGHVDPFESFGQSHDSGSDSVSVSDTASDASVCSDSGGCDAGGDGGGASGD